VRSWTTTDLCGNARDHTQTVTIKDVTGPEFTVPADITVPCGTDLMDTLVTGNAANGFDECEGVEVAVIATIMDELTQENMPCSGSNSYIKRWKAVDGCNNVTTKDQIIVVDCDDSNCIDALLFTAPRDTKTSCEFGYGMEVTGEPELSSNLCPTLSYEVTFTDNFADPICEGGEISLFQDHGLFQMPVVTKVKPKHKILWWKVHLLNLPFHQILLFLVEPTQWTILSQVLLLMEPTNVEVLKLR